MAGEGSRQREKTRSPYGDAEGRGSASEQPSFAQVTADLLEGQQSQPGGALPAPQQLPSFPFPPGQGAQPVGTGRPGGDDGGNDTANAQDLSAVVGALNAVAAQLTTLTALLPLQQQQQSSNVFPSQLTDALSNIAAAQEATAASVEQLARESASAAAAPDAVAMDTSVRQTPDEKYFAKKIPQRLRTSLDKAANAHKEAWLTAEKLRLKSQRLGGHLTTLREGRIPPSYPTFKIGALGEEADIAMGKRFSFRLDVGETTTFKELKELIHVFSVTCGVEADQAFAEFGKERAEENCCLSKLEERGKELMDQYLATCTVGPPGLVNVEEMDVYDFVRAKMEKFVIAQQSKTEKEEADKERLKKEDEKILETVQNMSREQIKAAAQYQRSQRLKEEKLKISSRIDFVRLADDPSAQPVLLERTAPKAKAKAKAKSKGKPKKTKPSLSETPEPNGKSKGKGKLVASVTKGDFKGKRTGKGKGRGKGKDATSKGKGKGSSAKNAQSPQEAGGYNRQHPQPKAKAKTKAKGRERGRRE